MPRFLRLKNDMIHVPSLSSVSIGTSCMGYPYISLYYHTKQSLKISYSKWDECERDFNRVKKALKEVECSLEGIVLTEELVSSESSSKIVLPPTETQPVGPVESVSQ